MYSVLCTVFCVQCIVYSDLRTVIFVHCFMYSVLCTVFCVQCFMYSVLCTVFFVQCFQKALVVQFILYCGRRRHKTNEYCNGAVYDNGFYGL